MSNKKLRHRGEEEETSSIFGNRALTLVGGALVVVVFIVVGIVLVTLLGGDDLSKPDPKQPELPALGALPDAPRSSVADLLENASFDTMSADDRAKVAAEVLRMFADTDVRGSSPVILGLDISRRGGQTRATREYRISADNPGATPLIVTSTSFFCDGTPGTVDLYRLRDTGLDRETEYDTRSVDSPPVQRLFSGMDWSAAKDLGFREINGRRAHGAGLLYRPQATSEPVNVEQWFDVENGRLLYYVGSNGPELQGWTFDWRTPPPITVPEGLNTPPCAAAIIGE